MTQKPQTPSDTRFHIFFSIFIFLSLSLILACIGIDNQIRQRSAQTHEKRQSSSPAKQKNMLQLSKTGALSNRGTELIGQGSKGSEVEIFGGEVEGDNNIGNNEEKQIFLNINKGQDQRVFDLVQDQNILINVNPQQKSQLEEVKQVIDINNIMIQQNIYQSQPQREKQNGINITAEDKSTGDSNKEQLNSSPKINNLRNNNKYQKQNKQQNPTNHTNTQKNPTHITKQKPPSTFTVLQPQQLQFAKKLLNLENEPGYQNILKQQAEFYQQKYNISAYDQLPFCVVVPSYNNSMNNRYLSNINSILQQNYTNYHIVFIDDASEDGTGLLMRHYTKMSAIPEQRLKIIVNQKRKMALANLRMAAREYCRPYEIFLTVDGDDMLLGRQVLKLFNAIFQNYDTWLVYTNFINRIGQSKNILPGYSRSYETQVIQNNSYRKQLNWISHLRAFYTKLFLLIKEQDLKNDKGQWYRAANDIAIYMPILQMCHDRFGYFPQITYVYDSNTGLNNFRTKGHQQKNNEGRIRVKQAYKPLQYLFTKQELEELEGSIIGVGNKQGLSKL